MGSSLTSMAWRNVQRQKRRSFLAALAMAMGVAVTMSLITWMAGMWDNMEVAMVDRLNGHFQISHPDYPATRQMFDAIEDVDTITAKLDANPDVTAYTVRMYGAALLGSDERTEGASLLGIIPSSESRFQDMDERITRGAWLPDEPGPQVVLGSGLAKRLKIDVGDELVAVSQAADGSLGNELYTVTGIIHTDLPQMDRTVAYIHLQTLSELLALEGRAHEIIALTPDRQMDALTPIVADIHDQVAPAGLVARPWWEVDPAALQLMSMRGVQEWITTLLFLGASVIGVINTMLMAVMERTREFGVLRALGMRKREIIQLVVAESSFLGLIAAVAGGILGGLISWYLVVHGIDMSVGGKGWEMGTVTIDPIIHGKMTLRGFLLPAVILFGFCVLAALWPAWKAARLNPVDALRAE